MQTEATRQDGANSTTEAGQQQQGAAEAATTTVEVTEQNQTTQTEGQAQPEAKAEGEQKTEESKEQGAKPTAPEKYEDFKMPEGVKLDTEVTTKFTELAKELNLDQTSAQKLADLGGELASKFSKHTEQVVTQAKVEWLKQAAADQEIGGARFDENRATANRALQAFGTPALKTLLDESGLGDHPEVIRAFYKVGSKISEDTVVTGGDGKSTASDDPASVLFPTMKQA